ncbi:hypothetical protein D3C79_1005650 [compost metagenome]
MLAAVDPLHLAIPRPVYRHLSLADADAGAGDILAYHKASIETFEQGLLRLYQQGARLILRFAAGEHQLPLLEVDQTLLLVEGQVHRTARVQLHQ